MDNGFPFLPAPGRGALPWLIGILLLAALTGVLLRAPFLPARLRLRLRGTRLLLAVDLGWAFWGYRIRWRWPAPQGLHRWLQPRGLAVLTPGLGRPFRAQGPSRGGRAPVPEAALRAGWQWLRTGRWRRLTLRARVGTADAAVTAWLAGGLHALLATLASGVANRADRSGRRPTVLWSVEPSFQRPRWEARVDCIVRWNLWDAMTALRATGRAAAEGSRPPMDGAGSSGGSQR